MSKTIRRVLLAALVSFVVYPLSYAPLHRFVIGPDSDFFQYESSGNVIFQLPDAPTLEIAYCPIRFLIARGPLRGPLLRWSKVWQVDGQHFMKAVRLNKTISRWW